MVRKKKKIHTKKSKKRTVHKKPLKKSQTKILIAKYLKDLKLVIGLFLVVFAIISFVLLRKQIQKSPQFASSPIRHLIASISAQKLPIKIDPEFSYSEEPIKKEGPIRIVIPSLKIDARVVDAQIIDGFWETATESASFGLGSAYPEEIGNTVIFAHARQGLFANLGFLQKDAVVYLFTPSKWFAYKVKEVKTVLPNQVEVVSPTQDKTLTLYTCSGYRDAYRLVVIAKPEDN